MKPGFLDTIKEPKPELKVLPIIILIILIQTYYSFLSSTHNYFFDYNMVPTLISYYVIYYIIFSTMIPEIKTKKLNIEGIIIGHTEEDILKSNLKLIEEDSRNADFFQLKIYKSEKNGIISITFFNKKIIRIECKLIFETEETLNNFLERVKEIFGTTYKTVDNKLIWDFGIVDREICLYINSEKREIKFQITDSIEYKNLNEILKKSNIIDENIELNKDTTVSKTTPEALNEKVENIKTNNSMDLRTKKERLFGEIACKLGFVTNNDVIDALLKQANDSASGKKRKHIGIYLFEAGKISKENIKKILLIQKKYDKK